MCITKIIQIKNKITIHKEFSKDFSPLLGGSGKRFLSSIFPFLPQQFWEHFQRVWAKIILKGYSHETFYLPVISCFNLLKKMY